MRVIWKFPLFEYRSVIEVPRGATVLTLQTQGANGCLWFDVPDHEAPFERRSFRIFGTGQPFPDDFIGKYIGTHQVANGALVWHVYEEIR